MTEEQKDLEPLCTIFRDAENRIVVKGSTAIASLHEIRGLLKTADSILSERLIVSIVRIFSKPTLVNPVKGAH